MKKLLIIITLISLLLFSGCMSTPISTIPTEENGGVPVNLQDQTTRPISLRLNTIEQTGLTLSQNTVVNSKYINLTPGHGLSIGDYIILIQENGEPQFYFGKILDVNVNTITMDSLITYPFNYNIAYIIEYNPNLNRDGSTTPIIAELCNPFSTAIDLNRLIFHMTSGSSMDDGKFGSLNALTNGIALRKSFNATNKQHFWNIKTNGELKQLSYDVSYDDKAPAGVYGIGSRLSYNGQDKHGVAIRVEKGECLEMPIQDDLTGLDSFHVTVEGHFTEGK